MYHWIPYAFVRIAACYGSGIAIAFVVAPPASVLPGVSMLLFGAVSSVVLIAFGFGKRVFTGIVVVVTLAGAGTINGWLSNGALRADHLINLPGEVSAYKAVVTKPAEEKPATWRYEVLIEQVLLNDTTWRSTETKTLLYVRKSDRDTPFRYGDVLVVQSQPQRIPAPLNPHAFDMAAFQSYRNIYFQDFTMPADVHIIGSEPPNRIVASAIRTRQAAEQLIRRCVNGHRESGMASAFVLGVTDGVDNDLMKAYAATGVMHVLSVSGLHVGIVYWALLMIFKPIGSRAGKWPLLIASLGVLWSYAFITGLSAPVLRAVMMFSFTAIARAWSYKANIYNTLAATAFLLLVYDPFMIMSVGFQLSFIAVLGIVALQPPIYEVWEPGSRIVDEIWKLCSVSIAAQVATLPLCLWYFHQFPNYFLVSNLFMVPGSFIVLLLGIALLATGWLPVVSVWIGWTLEFFIGILNQLIFFVERLPFSVVNNLFITKAQCASLMLLVVALWVLIETKKKSWLVVSLAGCLAFAASSWAHSLTVMSPRLTVYASRTHTMVDMSSRGQTHFIGNADGIYGAEALPNRIYHRCADRVMPLQGIKVLPGVDVYVWKGLRIAYISGPLKKVSGQVVADLVIISHNAVEDIGRFSERVTASIYVVDGTNSLRRAKALSEAGKMLNLDVHSVALEGAYSMHI